MLLVVIVTVLAVALAGLGRGPVERHRRRWTAGDDDPGPVVRSRLLRAQVAPRWRDGD